MRPLACIAVLFAVACSASESGSTVNRDTLTQRQKDSILAQSRIPGAAGVGRAMRAADSIAVRVRRADSLAQDTTPE